MSSGSGETNRLKKIRLMRLKKRYLNISHAFCEKSSSVPVSESNGSPDVSLSSSILRQKRIRLSSSNSQSHARNGSEKRHGGNSSNRLVTTPRMNSALSSRAPFENEDTSVIARSQNQTESGEGSTTSRKGRGPASGDKLEKHVKKYGRYKIVFAPREKIPADHEAEFATGIGIVIRHNAEIDGVTHWKEIPQENKDVCYARLLHWFDIDGWSTDERVRNIVNEKMQTAYTRWRHTLHRTYKNLVDEDINPREVCPRTDLSMEKWKIACDFIEDEAFQAKSQINTQNRSKKLFNHTSGKVAILSRFRKMEVKSKVDLWRDVHTKKRDGEFVNDVAKSLHENMVAKRNQHEDGEPTPEEEILSSALGRRSGYVKGMGHGIEVVRGGQLCATSSNVDLQKTVEDQKKELGDLRAQMASMQQLLESLSSSLPNVSSD